MQPLLSASLCLPNSCGCTSWIAQKSSLILKIAAVAAATFALYMESFAIVIGSAVLLAISFWMDRSAGPIPPQSTTSINSVENSTPHVPAPSSALQTSQSENTSSSSQSPNPPPLLPDRPTGDAPTLSSAGPSRTSIPIAPPLPPSIPMAPPAPPFSNPAPPVPYNRRKTTTDSSSSAPTQKPPSKNPTRDGGISTADINHFFLRAKQKKAAEQTALVELAAGVEQFRKDHPLQSVKLGNSAPVHLPTENGTGSRVLKKVQRSHSIDPLSTQAEVSELQTQWERRRKRETTLIPSIHDHIAVSETVSNPPPVSSSSSGPLQEQAAGLSPAVTVSETPTQTLFVTPLDTGLSDQQHGFDSDVTMGTDNFSLVEHVEEEPQETVEEEEHKEFGSGHKNIEVQEPSSSSHSSIESVLHASLLRNRQLLWPSSPSSPQQSRKSLPVILFPQKSVFPPAPALNQHQEGQEESDSNVDPHSQEVRNRVLKKLRDHMAGLGVDVSPDKRHKKGMSTIFDRTKTRLKKSEQLSSPQTPLQSISQQTPNSNDSWSSSDSTTKSSLATQKDSANLKKNLLNLFDGD